MTVVALSAARRPQSPSVLTMMSAMASDHLREVVDGKTEGLAVVSISTLLVVLDRVDHLDGRTPTQKEGEEN